MKHKQSVEIFNTWDLYDNIVRSNWMRHEQMAQFIQNATAGLKLRVLDLGCGDGAMARNGLVDCQVDEYVGIDLSQDALTHLQASSGLGANPQTVLGDIHESIQQLPQGSFDLVLASYSLHHFQRDEKLSILGQIRRVLSQEGRFLWIDIACLEGEDRSGYVSRIEHEIQTAWMPMSQQHSQDAIEHIRNHDFPEQQSWMIQAWEQACQVRQSKDKIDTKPPVQVDYRDAFYIALRMG